MLDKGLRIRGYKREYKILSLSGDGKHLILEIQSKDNPNTILSINFKDAVLI